MHIGHDHSLGADHAHAHEHSHTHEHTHDGVTHTHEHTHEHAHEHAHPHEHELLHGTDGAHEHGHDCGGACSTCGGCSHTPMEELLALMKYMIGHNAAHAQELAGLAHELDKAGSHVAYEQVMAAVSDFEKGNLRLSTVLQSLDAQ